ncbi:MAG: GGDEF domain-containing protein [Candidatus Omnitrophica bacterium]|nr:GGDEF domain-containing protein [Candidatus Omnitrophota bacterium]
MSGRLQPTYLYLASPFFLSGIIYLFICRDRIAVRILAIFYFSSTLYAILQTENLAYLRSSLILAVGAVAVSFYQKMWHEKVQGVEEKKLLTLHEKQALEERHQTRLESLKHLEKRVNGLIHLFEIARDFNECLDFTQLGVVLDQQITPEFNFERGTLILVELIPQGEMRLVNQLTFGRRKREDPQLSEKFAHECLKVSRSGQSVMKIDLLQAAEKTQFEPYATQAPLWLFSLFIERQLIGILAVEGGSATDYQKFEVLASQLSLQAKKVKLYETVKENSIIDGLTKVFVRRHFFERFREELKRAVRFQFSLSVLMVDVDHFKSYNDKFGHLVGDRTLKEVAQVIRDHMRRVDVIGRYGGEEFIIVAPEIQKREAMELAERIRSAVAHKSLRLYDEETRVTVSIGLSSFPEDLGTSLTVEYSDRYVETLVQLADQALYRAKEEGRNRVIAHKV